MTPRKKAAPKEKQLTPVELELMTILWKIGQGSVTEIQAALPQGRDLAYTSVSTILRILESKGVLDSRKEGRGHAYFPLLAKEDYETNTVRQLVTRVFDGAPASLVRRLIETDGMSDTELAEIRSLLDERLGDKERG